MKKFTRSPYLSLAILMIAGSAAASQRGDAWITMKAKMALLTSPDVAGLPIDVDTMDGQVTLHGKVESLAQEREATRIAKAIEGVTGVRNLLQVVPGSRRAVVKGLDADIRQSAKAALDADRSISDSAIRIDSVNNGVVLLTGTATSASDSRRAIVVVRDVPGVVRVDTKVISPDRFTDDELYKARKADEPVDDSWQASDAWTTTAIKLRLLAAADTPGLAINVDTNDGVVTLFGTVASEASKKSAEAEAMKVEDVVRVVNALQVVAEPQQAIVEAKDDQIHGKVVAALAANPDLDKADIDVQVENGVVRLTGTIAHPGDRLDAIVSSRRVAGVRSVRDELTLQVAVPSGG